MWSTVKQNQQCSIFHNKQDAQDITAQFYFWKKKAGCDAHLPNAYGRTWMLLCAFVLNHEKHNKRNIFVFLQLSFFFIILSLKQ